MSNNESLMPYILGAALGTAFNSDPNQEEYDHAEYLEERFKNGYLEDYFKLYNIDIYDKKTREHIENFEKKGCQKEYLLKLIEAKKKPIDKRYTVEDNPRFINDVSNHTLRELQSVLERDTMTYTVYLKWKKQEDKKAEQVRLRREALKREEERRKTESGLGPTGLQVYMIIMISAAFIMIANSFMQ